MGLLGGAGRSTASPRRRGGVACRAPWPTRRRGRGAAARLMDRLDHPRWIEVADRCLACANCTMVCPTCFCTSVGAVSDLDGAVTTTERRWDSCFNGDFAKVAGGNFRPRRQDRYRQWLTHKFATWHEQFGTSGCVGCGRCITWCPVGIDVREELAAIAHRTSRASSQAPPTPLDGLVPLPLVSVPPSLRPRAARSDTSVATVRAVMAETTDTSTLGRARDDHAARGATRPVRDGRAARVLAGPDLGLARRRRAAVAHHPRRRPATRRSSRCSWGPGRPARPAGAGWPLERALGRDVVIVAGGIGLARCGP